MIGGAGAYSVTDTFAWTESLIALCQLCAERRLPLFGSCWGHQFYRARVRRHRRPRSARAEMGTREIELTDAGRADPLFGELPPPLQRADGPPRPRLRAP